MTVYNDMVCQYLVYVSVPYFMSPRSSEDCARKTVQMPAAEAEVQGFRTSHRLTSAECRYLVGSFCDEYTVYPHSTFDLIWLDHDTWWILTPNWIMIWDLSPNSLSLSLSLSRYLTASRVISRHLLFKSTIGTAQGGGGSFKNRTL